jgi:glucose/arabinose dehydrogenase
MRLRTHALVFATLLASLARAEPPTRTGRDAFGDCTSDAPGLRRKITVADLPPPYATRSVDNGPRLVARPKDAWPRVPAGFRVDLFQRGLSNPRALRTAPNGDVFVAESQAGRVRVLRARDGAAQAERSEIFAGDLELPFGIAFYPPGPDPRWIYVAETGGIVRFPYRNGDLTARGPRQKIADLPSGGRLRGGGHWTRDLAFSRDGKHMYVSVGSRSNVGEDGEAAEARRADILELTPEGRDERTFARGVRNAVGIAVHPRSGELWASVNERDGLGDDLVPDYVTRVRDGGFYGWPWFYLGGNPDPQRKGEHPELRTRTIAPDVLLQAHSASLQLAFYEGKSFGDEYVGDAFAAEHGSWNRRRRTGYKLIRIPQRDGVPTGEYIDFMTGFVTDQGDVWGRPVGVTVAHDGSLLVSDDGGEVIWRISRAGAK